ncbi:hypothetical protein K470DRAFT_271698 [Piedraia hortae CBS 480.64]|uniref:Queuosine 5'-phosphate N-glycosylase/hydrolase n=1 Tax=Piedraia hortae CBS 480.64 TaxID=1314780 RepID=A0A6A7BXM1_9PEZI|nr:hypothetical protein K470DRAFT_271698 [Piedraia hortae CBS 480.64]
MDDLDEVESLRRFLEEQRKVASPEVSTGVLEDAEFIADNAIDVFPDLNGTRSAAKLIAESMEKRGYSLRSWSAHSLHPSREESSDVELVDYVFMLDLLNFSFWSVRDEKERFKVEYRDKVWTGYDSLLAALRRALDEGIPVTRPQFWGEASDEKLRHVFRSATDEEMPLLSERVDILRGAASVLKGLEMGSVYQLIEQSNHSAIRLINLLTKHFSSFQDTAIYKGRKVHFYKRSQIFVADLWGAFQDSSIGHFTDIDSLTMFADYRVPQMLHTLGVLSYSPPLLEAIKDGKEIPSGSDWEIQLRGCSIWAVELIRRRINKSNAVLIDFYLYDLAKEKERSGVKMLPHHRTRSIWY